MYSFDTKMYQRTDAKITNRSHNGKSLREIYLANIEMAFKDSDSQGLEEILYEKRKLYSKTNLQWVQMVLPIATN